MTKRVNSYQATAALMRAFFEAFGTAIVDSKYPGDDFNEKNNPSNIKQAMLEHYEEIGNYFMDIMLPTLIRLNYSDEEKVEEDMLKLSHEKQISIQDYLKFACKTTKLYEATVNEYKRNMELLLGGMFSTIQEHLEQYTKGIQLAAIDEPIAIQLMVRTIMKAYAAGIRTVKNSKLNLNQITILRLLLINTNILINNRTFEHEGDDLIKLFEEACGNETNINVLFNTLEDMYKELAEDEGASNQEKAN
jgi:hypothetical protein